MSDDAFARHRSLLFTVAYEMLGSAADAEDVVQETWLRWADVDHAGGARPAGLPGPHRHPSGAEPAADGGAPARGLRRRMAARAAADEPRRRRRRRARRERVDRHAHRARDARPGRARRVRAPRGVRHPLRRDRRGGRQVTGRRPPDRPPRPRPRRRSAPADAGQHAPSSRRPWTGSSPPSGTATCKASSTSWPPTSSSSPTAAASSPRLVARSRAPNGWPAS